MLPRTEQGQDGRTVTNYVYECNRDCLLECMCERFELTRSFKDLEYLTSDNESCRKETMSVWMSSTGIECRKDRALPIAQANTCDIYFY